MGLNSLVRTKIEMYDPRKSYPAMGLEHLVFDVIGGHAENYQSHSSLLHRIAERGNNLRSHALYFYFTKGSDFSRGFTGLVFTRVDGDVRLNPEAINRDESLFNCGELQADRSFIYSRERSKFIRKHALSSGGPLYDIFLEGEIARGRVNGRIPLTDMLGDVDFDPDALGNAFYKTPPDDVILHLLECGFVSEKGCLELLEKVVPLAGAEYGKYLTKYDAQAQKMGLCPRCTQRQPKAYTPPARPAPRVRRVGQLRSVK